MKIIRLQSENIKKIKAVDISPASEMVKISGKNGQGKSSVLDSILYALVGKKAIPSKPIRDGEENAKIVLDLGDLIVTRTFTEKDSYLKVTTKDGAAYGNAQEKLSELVSGVSFDPLEFANMDDKDQVETLVNILGIKVELARLEDQRKERYEERTIANRDVKDKKSFIEGLEKPEEGLENKEEVSAAKVSEELETEREKFRQIQEAGRTVTAATSTRDTAKNEVTRLENLLKTEKAKLVVEEKKVKDAVASEKKLKDAFDEKTGLELRTKLDSLDETNAKIRGAKEYARKKTELAELEKTQSEVQKELEEIEQEKKDLIANAKAPIAGLDVQEGIVLFNGIPFAQLATSEKLKVSMSISMAMSPELRVIRIMDGSLLDEDNMKIIQEMAVEKDYQVWVEVVDSSGEIGIVIEEGEVAKVN